MKFIAREASEPLWQDTDRTNVETDVKTELWMFSLWLWQQLQPILWYWRSALLHQAWIYSDPHIHCVEFYCILCQAFPVFSLRLYLHCELKSHKVSGLFFWLTVYYEQTAGSETFSVETALHNKWEKINNALVFLFKPLSRVSPVPKISKLFSFVVAELFTCGRHSWCRINSTRGHKTEHVLRVESKQKM